MSREGIGPEPPPIEEEWPESRPVSDGDAMIAEACDLTNAEVNEDWSQRAMTRPRPVPVLSLRRGTGNQHQEPVGTTRNHLFEPLSAFLERSASLPDPAWLIDGLIPELGQVWILGAPGCGKTWFAFTVAKTAASKGRDVFIVEEEGSAKGLHNRFKELGFAEVHEAHVHISHARGVKLHHRLAELVEAVKHAHSPVLILDPMTALFIGDENATEDASRFRDQLGELLRSHPGLLVLVLHHTSKGAERSEASTYAGRGSSVFTGAADLELLFKRRSMPKSSGCVAFNVSIAKPPRELEQPEPMRLTIRLGTGELEAEPIEEERDDKLRGRILDVLRKAIEPMSKNGITKAVGAQKARVNRTVDAMVEEGALEKVGTGFKLQTKGEVDP